jgi:NodT family efflux transporter outer membrane factor (OMF) lipoprotein
MTGRIAIDLRRRTGREGWVKFAGVLILVLFASGCRTSFREYVNNGFKVGPNYQTVAAPVSDMWIDDRATEINSGSEPFWDWWRVFNDSKLEELVQCAKAQNLTLREAGFRIEEARALRGVAVGNLFPQQQLATGAYRRQQLSQAAGLQAGGGGGGFGIPRNFDVWNVGSQLTWELDFWGRYRRAIEAADATLDSSIETFDSLFVIMLADVAATYVEIRTAQQRIRYAENNVISQKSTLELTKVLKEGGRGDSLDVARAEANVAQTEATIPPLQAQLRQAKNRLCVLMGVPPQNIDEIIGEGVIPKAPAEVAIGVPADLLRRRPDVRRAERLAAAQSARIGVAESALYPAFSVTGSVFYQAGNFGELFQPNALGGAVGPNFNWQVLNYGRLVNGIDAEEARFMALATAYQNAVLNANREAEDALVGFLQAQQQVLALQRSVRATEETLQVVLDRREGGAETSLAVFIAQLDVVRQQDLLAQAEGSIAANLVETYRALGGGWELRLEENQGAVALAPPEQPKEEPIRLRRGSGPIEAVDPAR